MRLDDLDYPLPDTLIAKTPATRRDEARLLVTDPVGGAPPRDHTVADLPDLLRAGDLLVVNDTKVLPARFDATRHDTGGAVEGLFIETRNDETWHVMLRSGGKPTAGERIDLTDNDWLELSEKQADGSWLATKHSALDTEALLDAVGSMPLPPYIRHQRDVAEASGERVDGLDALDRERYQTVYARQGGAVAAPTAGLHFTDELMARLEEADIQIARLTLHVGLGTFAPVRAERLEDHDMHAERFTVPAATLGALLGARREGRRIIPVGTTSVRALESLPDTYDASVDYHAETRLLIQPGFEFRWTDGLMTNFHLPKSTLLALVAALTGLDRLLEIYRVAVEREYRFYSYGDAMLIEPRRD
ncbi:MAG: tRNA preQ1(34) S-adenosylmethionine ribosyltransferase-isomerase QueA [Planctomycetota bacterium]|jgi:S-adenosylmethionine:tRNA ribosyltransferase-isomerase